MPARRPRSSSTGRWRQRTVRIRSSATCRRSLRPRVLGPRLITSPTRRIPSLEVVWQLASDPPESDARDPRVLGADVAAGLREPGALDHRAAPDVAGPLGDAARGLPLDARPGADRAEDRRSRGAGRAAWLTIDPKLGSSIIESLSVFLSVFRPTRRRRDVLPAEAGKGASRLARGPADAAVFAGRRRAPAPAARPGDRRGQGPRLEHARGDRPRLGNRPGRNETSTLHRRGGAARQASGGAVAVGDGRLRWRVWTASMPASAAMGPAGLDARLTLVRNPRDTWSG